MLYKNVCAIGVFSGLLALVMMLTHPSELSARVLIVVFALIYLLTTSVVFLLLQLMKKFGILQWSLSKIFKLGAIGGVVPVYMIILHSIGQLTIRDVLLTFTFFGLLYFYFNRMTVKTRS